VVGVRTPTLRRSAVAEPLLLLGAAVALGLPSGYVAARLVLPSVPEFSDPTPVVLRYSPSLLVAGATAAALAVLLVVAAVVGGWALARAAVPSRLREAAR
jgi:alkylhydroperoxidase/carboxymuconolactone decarboxylase family protein YurZ